MKNFIILILVIALLGCIGYFFLTNSNSASTFNLAVWKGHSTYNSFANAIDVDELFGRPIGEIGFRSMMAISFLSSFISPNDDISFDMVSGAKLTERYNVSASLRNKYNYLTKISRIKNTENYAAYYNGESWVVIQWSEK